MKPVALSAFRKSDADIAATNSPVRARLWAARFVNGMPVMPMTRTELTDCDSLWEAVSRWEDEWIGL